MWRLFEIYLEAAYPNVPWSAFSTPSVGPLLFDIYKELFFPYLDGVYGYFAWMHTCSNEPPDNPKRKVLPYVDEQEETKMKLYIDSTLPPEAAHVGELILKVANRYYSQEIADQVEEHMDSTSDNADTTPDDATSITLKKDESP